MGMAAAAILVMMVVMMIMPMAMMVRMSGVSVRHCQCRSGRAGKKTPPDIGRQQPDARQRDEHAARHLEALRNLPDFQPRRGVPRWR
jgi:hypothetical protein